MHIYRWLNNYIDGFGSLLGSIADLNSPQPNLSDEEKSRIDAEALASDWEAVGNDMRWAMAEVDKEMSDKSIN